MNLRKKTINGTVYVYERKHYRDKKTGKVKTKEKILGHYDKAGNFIPSKGRTLNNLPAEIHEITTTVKRFRVVEKKPNLPLQKNEILPLQHDEASKVETTKEKPILPLQKNEKINAHNFNLKFFHMSKREITDGEIREQALAFMRELNIYPRDHNIELILDGELHRYDIEGDRRGSINGSYIIHPDNIPAGYFKDWKKGIETNWTFSLDGFTDEQVAYFNSDEYKEKIKARQEERLKKLREEQARVSEEARTRFEQLKQAPVDHPYLTKKEIGAYDLRYNPSTKALAVPLKNVDGKFISLQWIFENGEKRFYTGASNEGAFFSIGLEALKKDKRLPILIGEGVATMAKVHELLHLPVVAAMSCSALEKITKIIKNKYKRNIIIMADNDCETEQKRGWNPGTQEAKKIVEEAKLAVAYFAPPFNVVGAGTDWDDYLMRYGDRDKAVTDLKEKIAWWCMSEEERQEVTIRKSLSDLISELNPSIDLPPQEFIGGLFPRKFISAIVAPSGTGKTMFMQKIVSDLSVGGTFFDGFAEDEPPRKCLIFAGEAGYELLLRRGASLKWAINPQRVKVIDQYKFESNNKSVMLNDDDGWKNITRIVDMTTPDIVFFDTFTSFHEKDENKATEMKPIIKKLTDLAREYNMAIVLIHHSRKRTAKERSLSLNQDDVIGSSVFNRLVALIVGIEPMKEDEKILLVRPLKTWFSVFMPFTYQISEDSNGRTVVETDLAPEGVNNSKIAVWNYLRANFTPGEWFTMQEVNLSEISPPVSYDQRKRIFANLVKTGKLKKQGSTKATEYSVVGFYG